MTTSMFDPDAFLNTETEGANSTKSIPVPEGEYRAVIEKVAAREWKDNENKTVIFLDVTWKIDDPDGVVQAVTKREKNIIVYGIALDMMPARGGAMILDMSEGMNVRLGKLRAAVGQNTERRWAPNMLQGQVATILVGSRTDKDTGDIFATVKRVGSIDVE